VSGTAAVRISGPITEPHQISLCYSSALHCHMHEVDEPCVPPFRWCLECGHTFASAAELLAAHNEHLARYGGTPETDPGKVFCCPLCLHSW
jgi:hypothetical protein